MPIYEYECRACGTSFEVIERIDGVHDHHPCECGAQGDRRIGSFAVMTASRAQAGTPPAVPLRRQLPSSLRGVGGTREGVAHYQRVEEKLARFEARNPEFADRRMPVVSHEHGKPRFATQKGVGTAAAGGKA